MKKNDTNYYSFSRPEVACFIPDSIKNILDIGCGKGYFLYLVKTMTNAETWGIEQVSDLAGDAAKNVDHFICGKIEDILDSLPELYFDCITFNDVLEHLIDPADILLKVKSKLKPDGVIITSIPNVRYIHNLYELLIKKDWEYKEEGGILDVTHLRFFTLKSMNRLFEKTGYKVIKQDWINRTGSRKYRLFNLISLGIFRDTLYQQVVSVIKKTNH